MECSKAFEGPITGQTSPFIEEPGPGRRLSRPQSTPVTGALIFHRGRSQSAFDRVSGLRSDLHPQGLSTPARLDQLPSWDVLGCLLFSPLHMLFPWARKLSHLFLTWSASIYYPSQLSLGTPSSKKPPLIYAPPGGHLWAPTLPDDPLLHH